MSFSDYMAGLRDGFAAGFNAGYRKGVEDTMCAGYLSGYRDGYRDASLGLPYRPQQRLLEYRSTIPEPLPLPKIEPLQLPLNEPKFDLTPKIDLTPKYDPLPDYQSKFDPPSYDPIDLVGRKKKPWEF